MNAPLLSDYFIVTPNFCKKEKHFFEKHGGKSIFVGRFMGPIRAVLPFIAGVVRMPYRQFLIADIIAAIAWVPIYMLPGILLGQASQQLPPDVAIKLIFFVILLLLFSWLLYASIKSSIQSCYAWFSHLLNKQIAYLWSFSCHHQRFRSLASLLIDPRFPESHKQFTLALCSIFLFLAFLLLAFGTSFHSVATYVNEPIYYFMRSLRQPTLDKFFIAITELSPRVLCGFWAIVLAVLLFKRNFWTALHWGILGLLNFGLVDIFKYTIQLPRPHGLMHTPAGASFPSGHAVSSVALLGFFAVLTVGNYAVQSWRMLLYGLILFIVFLNLFSRIYLTAHWLTDIIGGVFLGMSLVTGVTLSYRRKRQRNAFSATKLGVIGFVVLFILWGANLIHEYPQQLQNYRLYVAPKSVLDIRDWWQHAKQQKPIYRMNRFGKPIETLNIQWAETLPNIQHHLEKRGWHTLHKAKFLTTLYQLSLRQHDSFTPPFISDNAGEKPALTMLKYYQSTHTLLVLKLWRAHTQFSNGTPLWLGIAHYQKTWHLQFQPLQKSHVVYLASADNLLQKDLQLYRVKRVPLPSAHTAMLLISRSH